MSGPASRLSKIASQLLPSSLNPQPDHDLNYFHTLSPAFFLPRTAAIEPEAEAIYHVTADGKTLRRTYRQFADRACGLAHYLKKHGYKRVGILCPNTPAYLESLFAIGAAGAVNVGVNYRLKADDIAYIFNHADVDLIIVDSEYRHLLNHFHTTNPSVHLILDSDLYQPSDLSTSHNPFDLSIHEGNLHNQSLGSPGWASLSAQVGDENDLLALAYTSGTTARPKGVELTHRGTYLAALANTIESCLNHPTQRSKYLWTLPLFHAIGWTFPWAVTAVRGTHICLRRIDYPLIWRLLKTEGITHFNAAPTVNTLLCASQSATRLEKPVRVTVAASPPSAQLFEKMESLNLNPVHTYGLTETYGPITRSYALPSHDLLPPDQRFAKMARQGHGFLTSLPIRVIKPDVPQPGGLIDVSQNGREIGEIVCTGNICTRGYYKDPTATAKLFEGGVLHTGDLAVWHEDGAAQILDRKKDIIISGGENISSVGLESLLARHDAVLEIAVVGVKDEKWGERPVGFVTLRDGVKGEDKGAVVTFENAGGDGPSKLTKADYVVQWAKKQDSISGFMVPAAVYIVEELPKTSTGKVRKNVLREWAAAALG